MSLNVDRLANNGVVRIDTLGKLAAVDVNNVALLEALKPKETSRIYYSRNALWKMKFGAHDLLGLLPALAEKPPPLPPGLSSGTKQKKRPAAARDQMASDEESPKSKRQRAAGEHVSQTASMLHHALVGRWVEVYWPEDETWYRGRVTSQDGQKLRVLYDDGEAHSHAFRDDPFVGDGTPPFALEDAPQQWRYALARTTHASGDTPSVPASGASIRLRTPAPAPASSSSNTSYVREQRLRWLGVGGTGSAAQPVELPDSDDE